MEGARGIVLVLALAGCAGSPVHPAANCLVGTPLEGSQIEFSPLPFPGFAGTYLDGSDAYVVTGTKEESREAAIAYAAERLASIGYERTIRFVVVEYDRRQMNEWSICVSAHVGTMLSSQGYDPRDNRLEIGVPPPTSLELVATKVARLGIPEDAFEVIRQDYDTPDV